MEAEVQERSSVEEPTFHKGLVAGSNPAAPTTRDELLLGFIRTIIPTMIRGILFSVPAAPAQQVIIGCCRAFGEFVGMSIQGEEGAVRAARRQCRAAFREGMDIVAIQGHAKPQAASMTAVKEPNSQNNQ